jgi:hypothetical protein
VAVVSLLQYDFALFTKQLPNIQLKGANLLALHPELPDKINV